MMFLWNMRELVVQVPPAAPRLQLSYLTPALP